ncbi:uncharacterized protein LOC125665509 [Ostrea edulis]|uniref:uncharacterized protein LOC125665509 n=1 Tax=Ostrea edulis TaxID=37623 RepID=UPI0024AED2BE|nr:uncharacterized protein LOC125665509 [Ostrea edulis]
MKFRRRSARKNDTLCILLILEVVSHELVLSLMCLSCNESIQPRHCHSIAYCAEDEVCFVERVASLYGVRYNTGCLQKPVCQKQNETRYVHGNSDGNLQTPTCTECCSTDLCNAQGCGEPGYPPLSARGPICLKCSQQFNNEECREIAHCRNSELCFIKEESEFGDLVYTSGCMPFQQCISIISNTHALVDLSNMHHYTYSSKPHIPTSTPTTRLLTTPPTTALPTTTAPTTDLPTTTALPTTAPTTDLPTKKTTELGSTGILGKRERARKRRFTSCEHCCRGDLCNNVCVHYSQVTPTPHYFTASPAA